tara:strand:- start:284 stop:502 length:219 start_codon:yes stop_codon:yes gene_type:complete
MWEDVLKSSVKQEIDEYIKETKQGLYDMLLPTWEEDPQLLKKHIETMFAQLMKMILGGTAEEQYHAYKFSGE